jgi:hypothetical protein
MYVVYLLSYEFFGSVLFSYQDLFQKNFIGGDLLVIGQNRSLVCQVFQISTFICI